MYLSDLVMELSELLDKHGERRIRIRAILDTERQRIEVTSDNVEVIFTEDSEVEIRGKIYEEFPSK